MDVATIDKNLAVETKLAEKDIVFLNARCAPFRIYGILNPEGDEPMRRIPESVAKATSPGVTFLNEHTAGGRVRFSTDSPYVAIHVGRAAAQGMMPHFPLTGSHGLDLYLDETGEDGKFSSRYYGSFLPPTDALVPEYEAIVKGLPEGMHCYTLDLSLYASVKTLYIGVKEGSKIDTGLPYRNEKPVVFYGSSITQGGCASRPGNSYEAMISQKYNLDYINLGFSGSAKGEDAIADYMAELDPLLFVSDYDHNAPSADHLALTCKSLFEKFRKNHPETPYVLVSAPLVLPRKAGGRARRDIIRNIAEEARAAGDGKVVFVDGSQIFAGEWEDACTVDACHPNDLGFCRMAKAIGGAIADLLKL